MKILITGAWGLVGSTSVNYFLGQGHEVWGIDNNSRCKFFGQEASVRRKLTDNPRYVHHDVDILDARILIVSIEPDVIIHAAAQPSHDWSAKKPVDDFYVNAIGTLTLLDACRSICPECVFIYVSTNKVYGDHPNRLPLIEHNTRYEARIKGISEDMSVDNCIHSPFGVSKLTGDLYAQEYAKYYGMKTGIFRCGCITGAAHRGAELHGFLSYIARCRKERKRYKIYGYKGKQVRDNIHAYDLVTAFDEFIKAPRPGEVYNMGGGRHSNISVLEALKAFDVEHDYVDKPRIGDHKWYISDVSKFKSHYPEWQYQYNMEMIIENLIST